MNKEIEQYLRLFAWQRQDDWATLLPVREFMINSCVWSTLQHSPFEVMYGYQPDFTIPASRRSNIPAVNERLNSVAETMARRGHEDKI